MFEVQSSIFDIPLPPEAPVVEIVEEEEPQNTPAPNVEEPETRFEFDFDCTVPETITSMPILQVGDRVVILPAKYGHGQKVPGIVKAFIPSAEGIVVRRKDGEGFYKRYELYRI